MKKIVMSIFCVAVSFLLTAELHAVTIQFDSANYGPSNSLQFGDLTVTSWSGDGQPQTVSGSGLGINLIGPGDSIDGLIGNLEMLEGTPTLEGLTLSLSGGGTFNSFTIISNFSILGSDASDQLPFGMGWYATQYDAPPYPDYRTLDPSNPTPRTMAFPSNDSVFSFDIGPFTEFMQVTYFYDYMDKHPDVVLQYGFTIKSVDYTPGSVSVPEPSAVVLLVSGIMGLIGLKKYTKSTT